MQSDLSHIKFNFNNDNNKDVVQDEDSARLQEEAIRKMKERRGKQNNSAESKGEGVTLDDLFNGEADDAPTIQV